MKIKFENQYLIHVCPGCIEEHLIPMFGKDPWTFNQNFDSPTLSPSVKHTLTRDGKERICHYFIVNGMIEYCSDSDHVLAGMKVDLPEYPQDVNK